MSTPLFQRFLGIIGSFFQVGGPNGPGWNANTALEAKNSTNSAFVNARGLDPVATQDFVTLNYFNAHSSSGGPLPPLQSTDLALADNTSSVFVQRLELSGTVNLSLAGTARLMGLG